MAVRGAFKVLVPSASEQGCVLGLWSGEEWSPTCVGRFAFRGPCDLQVGLTAYLVVHIARDMAPVRAREARGGCSKQRLAEAAAVTTAVQAQDTDSELVKSTLSLSAAL